MVILKLYINTQTYQNNGVNIRYIYIKKYRKKYVRITWVNRRKI